MHIDPNAPCIALSKYAQLSALAWGLDAKTVLTGTEALHLYERNWRHLDTGQLDTHEQALIDSLVRHVGKGVLLAK